MGREGEAGVALADPMTGVDLVVGRNAVLAGGALGLVWMSGVACAIQRVPQVGTETAAGAASPSRRCAWAPLGPWRGRACDAAHGKEGRGECRQDPVR